MSNPKIISTPVPDSRLRVIALPFLAGIPLDDWLPILTSAVNQIEIGPFEVLYEQDTPIDKIYILMDGRISQYREDKVDGKRIRSITRTIGSGKLLGHLEFLFDDAYRTNARTDHLCLLLGIDIHAFGRLIYHFPQIRERLFAQDIAARLNTFPFMPRIKVPPERLAIIAGFLADEAVKAEYKPEQSIYRVGDVLDKLFLIDQGQVRLESAGEPPKLLGNGAMFGSATGASGFIGLGVGDRQMAQSAISTTKSNVYTLPYHSFISITGLEPDVEIQNEILLREQTINRMTVFSKLDPRQRRAIAGFVSHLYFPAMHLLIQQGEESDSMWVLLDGRASIRAIDKNGTQQSSAVAIAPTYFGELALLGQVSQESTVEAHPGSEWLRFHWRDLEAVSSVEKTPLRPLLNIRTTRQIQPVDDTVVAKYSWLQPGEQVVILSRRHWVAFVRKMLPAMIVFVFFLGAWIFADLIPGPQYILRPVIILLLVLDALALIWGTIDYFNDWLVVTNRRVMHQEKVLFVNEWRKEAPLEQIQNVDFRNDWLGKVLNYGTMTIATAATVGTISFDYTRHFSELRSMILSQREQRRRHTVAESKLTIQRMLEARLGVGFVMPSRVYRGGPAAPAPTGWRTRLSENIDTRMRREQNDRVIWRKHWLVLIPRLWFPLLVFGGLFVLALLGPLSGTLGAPRETIPFFNALTIVMVLLTLFALIRVIWVIADWRNDTYEVSNNEISHIDRVPLGLSEERMSAGLGRIQNVSMSVPSPIHWLFNFGDVTCQTAAEVGAFRFNSVPDPRAVTQEILMRMDNFRRQEERDAARKRSQELPDWFEMYNRIEPEIAEDRTPTSQS